MKLSKTNRRLMAVLLCGALILGTGTLPTKVDAASSSEIQGQIDELQRKSDEFDAQLSELEQQKNANLDDINALIDEKMRLDKEVFLLYSQIDNMNEQIAAYGVMIADQQQKLDEATARYQELSEKNLERVRTMEEDGSLSYWSVLFKASSFADFLDRLNMIEEINAADQRRLRDLDQAHKEVEQYRSELLAQKDALQVKKDDLAAKRDDLAEKSAEKDALLEALLARGDEYKEAMANISAAKQANMDEIAQKNDELAEAQYREWLATSVATTAPTTRPTETTDPDSPDEPTSPVTPSDSYWMMPLPYYVYMSSPFGYRYDPVDGSYSYHSGVDLAVAEGTEIYASRSGYVEAASESYYYGYYVKLDHDDGFESIYMHMQRFVVSPGEYVTHGQVIGYVGETGWATGPHLHITILYNGVYMDPLDYISI